jgi:hypothetical protein
MFDTPRMRAMLALHQAALTRRHAYTTIYYERLLTEPRNQCDAWYVAQLDQLQADVIRQAAAIDARTEVCDADV